jgi:[acyl-carrier-protein] S-malonyltransferase
MACDQSGEYVGTANDNCPGQMVISGTMAALERALELAKEKGAKRALPLTVSAAFHSPLMSEAADEFRRILNATPFQTATIPVITNATAGPLTDPNDIRAAVGKQLTSPVHWTDSMCWLIDHGVTRFVEVGPKEVLTGLMKRIDRSVERMTTNEIMGLN